MNYDDIAARRQHNPAWKLLRADNAPLILGFLGQVFIEENTRSISAPELISRLDDELFALNSRSGEDAFPKPAKAYLDDWAGPEAGWLRKYYPADSDEAHFDATPALEKAVAWVASLARRTFVGTESRLNTLVELLRQMVYGAETDPQARLAELLRRRREIDEQIAEVERGHLPLLDSAAQRDRYQQFASTARELLADFREVETNFRELDRGLRERIAAWNGAKGELLDEVLGSRSSITESDQGRSFQAFYDFLLSQQRQDELTELLDRVQSLEAITDADPRMRHIHYDWLDAGERTQATVRLLSEQLRRFLDDQVWLENRRVMDILHNIEAGALTLREVRAPVLTMEIDAAAPHVTLPLERPLYSASKRTALDSARIEVGEEDLDAGALFEQVYVDQARLATTVRAALRCRPQVSLLDLIEERPVEQGLAELVGYLALAEDDFAVVFDGDTEVRAHWVAAEGTERVATLPRVTFTRRTIHEGSDR